MMRVRAAWAAAVAILGTSALPVCAEERTSFAERFLYGGEVVFNASPKDPGYFNEADYRRNLLRLLRLNVALEFRAHDKIVFLTEIRSDNLDAPEPYALYMRVRPWAERDLDFQIGRIPPVFGAFARRRYNLDNPLIGSPLAYQYPTTVRADAAPEILDQLIAFRGHNVKTRYPIGDPGVMAGLPLVNPLKLVADVVIVAAAGRLVAYDLASGDPRWFGPTGGGGYSSPQLLTIDGVEQILLMSVTGATSVTPSDGALLWEHPWKQGTRIVQPALTADGDLLISGGEGTGMRRIALAHGPGGWTAECSGSAGR